MLVGLLAGFIRQKSTQPINQFNQQTNKTNKTNL